MKLGIFEKEYNIDWQEIKSIHYKSGNITVQKLDNSSAFFPVSKLDYSNVIAIKDVIFKLAENKNIECNI